MRYLSGRNYSPKKPKRSRGYWQKPTSRRVRHPTEHVFGHRTYRAKSSPFEGLATLPWGKLFLGVSALCWVLLMLYLPYFQVTRVSLAGLQLLKRDDVVSSIQKKFLQKSGWLPHANFFLINTKTVEEYLVSEYSLGSASVKKIFPSSLEAVIEEKVTSVIYDDGKNYSLIDQHGQLIRSLAKVGTGEYVDRSKAPFLANFDLATIQTNTATTSDPSTAISQSVHIPNFVNVRRNFGLFPIVYQLPNTGSTTTDSNYKITPETIQGIISLYDLINNQKLATPNYVVIGDKAAGAALVTDQPWRLYFDPEANISGQLKNAQIILQGNKPTDYIDVRYGDHVYWK